MEKMHRARYTLEYKLEALRLIGAGGMPSALRCCRHLGAPVNRDRSYRLDVAQYLLRMMGG